MHIPTADGYNILAGHKSKRMTNVRNNDNLLITDIAPLNKYNSDN